MDPHVTIDAPPQRTRGPLAFTGLDAIRRSEHTRLMLLGVAAGAIGGLAAAAFDWGLVMVGLLLLGSDEPSVGTLAGWKALLAPVTGGLLAGAFIQLGTERKRPQGIPDVIEGVAGDGRVSMREGLLSASASVSSVGSGMSGGREGPIVQVASSIVSWCCRRLGVRPHHTRVLVASAAAAGISATFDTPIGAAFFALEILLGNFALTSFAPVVAATVTGTVFGKWLLGEDRTAFSLPAFELEHPASLLIYPVLGLVCGLVAVAFKRLLLDFGALWTQSGIPPILRPAAAGLGVGIFGALGLSPVMGNGYGYMDQVIEVGGEPVIVLLVILVGKMVATAACSSSGAATGTYSPSLFVGAVTGVLFGEIAHFVAPTIAGPTGAYGMVGMGAVAAAVTQAPITSALMLFEATRNYQIILPLLLTLAVSGMVSSILERGSLYVKQLEQRGVKLERGREELVMYDIKVDDVMRRGQHTTVAPDAPFRELADRFLASRRDEVYIVDADGRLVGFVDIQDIKRLLADPTGAGVAGDLARTDIPTVQQRQPLADALPLFFRSGLEALPVIDDERRLIGVITERDVVGAYNREVLRNDVLLARIESGPPGDRTTDYFVLPDGHVMERIDVGPELVGRSLRDLQLQTRYGLTVMAVDQRQPDGGVRRCGARADLVLREGDTVVVVGTEVAVKALQQGAPPPDEASA